MYKNDLILLTETWTCKLTDIAVNRFHEVRLDKLVKNKSAKRNSDRIAIYIKDWLFKHTKVIKCERSKVKFLILFMMCICACVYPLSL